MNEDDGSSEVSSALHMVALHVFHLEDGQHRNSLEAIFA